MRQRMRFLFHGLVLAACAFALTPRVSAAEWGTLKGRFVAQGNVRAPAPIVAALGICAKANLVNEAVLVGRKGELANVLVYVRDKAVDAHPDYQKTAKDDVVLDNKGCRFEPHIVLLRTTQPLVIKNSDPDAHNTNVTLSSNASFNVSVPPNSQLPIGVQAKEETRPGNIVCNMHQWMKAYILIRDNPYSAVSRADGTFEIKNLPAGKELDFQLWHEKPGYLKDVKGGAGFATDAKGRVKLTIKRGENDLGDIKVPAALLQ